MKPYGENAEAMERDGVDVVNCVGFQDLRELRILITTLGSGQTALTAATRLAIHPSLPMQGVVD